MVKIARHILIILLIYITVFCVNPTTLYHGTIGGTWCHPSFCRRYLVPAGLLGLVASLISDPQDGFRVLAVLGISRTPREMVLPPRLWP
jgi:hypothetical protein